MPPAPLPSAGPATPAGKATVAKAAGAEAPVAPAQAVPVEAPSVKVAIGSYPLWPVAAGAGVGAFLLSFIVCFALAGAFTQAVRADLDEVAEVVRGLSPGRLGLLLLYAGHGVPFSGDLRVEGEGAIDFGVRLPALVSFIIPFVALLLAGLITAWLTTPSPDAASAGISGATIAVTYAATATVLSLLGRITVAEDVPVSVRGAIAPNPVLVLLTTGALGVAAGSLGGAFSAVVTGTRSVKQAPPVWTPQLYGALAAFLLGMAVLIVGVAVVGPSSGDYEDIDEYINVSTAPLLGGMAFCLGHGAAIAADIRAGGERHSATVSIFSQYVDGERMTGARKEELPKSLYLTPVVVALALIAGGFLAAHLSGVPSPIAGMGIAVFYLPLLVLLRFGLTASIRWSAHGVGMSTSGSGAIAPGLFGLLAAGALMSLVLGAVGGRLAALYQMSAARQAAGAQAPGAVTSSAGTPPVEAPEPEPIQTVPCSLCNKDMDRRLETCPHCGARNYHRKT